MPGSILTTSMNDQLLSSTHPVNKRNVSVEVENFAALSDPGNNLQNVLGEPRSQANIASSSLHDSDILTKATGDVRVEYTGSGAGNPAIDDRYKQTKKILIND